MKVICENVSELAIMMETAKDGGLKSGQEACFLQVSREIKVWDLMGPDGTVTTAVSCVGDVSCSEVEGLGCFQYV